MKTKRGGKPRPSSARRQAPKRFRLHKPDDERHGERVNEVHGIELSWEDVDEYKRLMRYCIAFSNNDIILYGEMEMLIKYYREMKKTIMTYVNPKNGNIPQGKTRRLLESLKRTAKRIIDETEGRGITTLNFYFYDLYDTIPDDKYGNQIIEFLNYHCNLFLSTDDNKDIQNKSFKDLIIITEIMEGLDLNTIEKKKVKRVFRKDPEIGKWNAISDIFYYFLSKTSREVRRSRKRLSSRRLTSIPSSRLRLTPRTSSTPRTSPTPRRSPTPRTSPTPRRSHLPSSRLRLTPRTSPTPRRSPTPRTSPTPRRSHKPRRSPTPRRSQKPRRSHKPRRSPTPIKGKRSLSTNKSFTSEISSLTRKARRYFDNVLSSPSLKNKDIISKKKIKPLENTYSIF